MQIFGCLIMIVLVGFFMVVAFGLSIIDAVLRLFGFKCMGKTSRDKKQSTPTSDAQPKKVFDDNEGEYIDFEEV